MIYKKVITVILFYCVVKLLENCFLANKLPINEEIYQPKYRDFDAAVKGVNITSYLSPKIGLCNTRLICGSSTTIGLILMSFYKLNANYLFIGALFLALPAISYIVLNTVIAPIYQKITVILIVIIPGLVNSSATCFLMAKKLWEGYYPAVQLDDIFMYLAVGSIIIHVRTIFLMPYDPLPADLDNYSIFENSLFSRIVFRRKNKDKKMEEKEPVAAKPLTAYLPVLKQLNYWCYLGYYTIITFRINTIRGWMYKFIDWTFSHVQDECGDDAECILSAKNQVSSLLNLNGYSYFALALIPFIPALMIKVIGKVLKSGLSGKVYGLIGLMVYCIVFSVINSLQMCQLADSLDDSTNTLFLIFISVSIVPLHYSTPCVFLTSFFPMDMFPFLYGIMKVPSIILMVINKPLYGMIIQGDDIIDADFCPVSIGLGIAAGVTIFFVIYIFIQGRKMLKNEKSGEEEERIRLRMNSY